MGILEERAGRQEGFGPLLPAVTAAVLMLAVPPAIFGWMAFDAGLFLYRCGADVLFTLTALFGFLRREAGISLRRSARIGAALGTVVVLAAAAGFCRLVSAGPLTLPGHLAYGWAALLAAAAGLTLSPQLHGAPGRAAWRHRLSLACSNAAVRRRRLAVAGLAALAVLRDGAEAALMAPALVLAAPAAASGGGWTAQAAGFAAGAGLLAAAAWLLPRLPGPKRVRDAAGFVPALTVFFVFKFIGVGVYHLQEAGLMARTPMDGLPEVPLLSFHPTQEGFLAQVLLLALAAGVCRWSRRRDREFIRRLNV